MDVRTGALSPGRFQPHSPPASCHPQAWLGSLGPGAPPRAALRFQGLPAAPRCSLASLLTIALHGKLEYYTGIMKELLVDLIDASATKNPKLMLRRTESVVEKMLTNWMSICMYSCLRVRRAMSTPMHQAPPLSQPPRHS